MARSRNYSNVKINHLTLLRAIRPGGRGIGAIWLARCDCGIEREVAALKVVHGQLKSCGKCQLSRDLALPGRRQGGELRAAERKLYMRYLGKAGEKSIPWDLTPEQFRSLIGGMCAYCGTAPDTVVRSTRLRYNGIDRVYVDKGYTQGNCTSACSTCRRLKGDLNAPEFLAIVMNVAAHMTHRMSQRTQK